MSAVLACAPLGVRAAVWADGRVGLISVIVTALSWGLASTAMGCSVANNSCPLTSTRPRTAYRCPGLIWSLGLRLRLRLHLRCDLSPGGG